MKRMLFVLLALLMVFGMAACNKDQNGDSSSDAPAVIKEYDLTQFTIVRPEGNNKLISSAVSSLYNQLKEKGITLELADDWVANESGIDATKPEILLGYTNRPQSAEAKAEIGEGEGYIIKFFETKIVIVARNNELLSQAVDAFVQNYLANLEGNVLKAELGGKLTGKQEGENIITLVKSGKAVYNIVYAAETASSTLKTAVTNLRDKMNDLTDAEVELTSDYGGYDKNAYNIVIGSTSFEESQDMMYDLNVDQYGFRVDGNKIVITGHTSYLTAKAVNMFEETIRNQIEQEADGSWSLIASIPDQEIGQMEGWLVGLPEFTGGTYKGAYECGNEAVQLYYTMVNANKIDGYVSQLASAGFAKKEDHTIGSNRYVTCVGEKGLVHLTYLHKNKSLAVISDSLTTHVYKESEPAYTKITETTLAVSSLDFSHREVLDGNGMSYIITLEDGRFVIIDGGYEQDKHLIYNYLVDNNKRSDGKIVIAAWIFTHSHADHYGGFKGFTPLYADKVQVEYFIANTGTDAMYGGDHDTYLEISMPEAVKQYYPGAKIMKPHTGQVLKFCNVEFQVLHTIEDYVPGLMYSENNASMVFRATINGQTILFMGDGERTLSNLMVKYYGSELKSDIIQVNHHGYSGGTEELYRLVNPTYSMWTTSQKAFEKRVSGVKYTWVGDALESNKYLYDKLGADHCFVADGKVEQITFNADKTISVAYYEPDYKQRTN
ncbi:MAG: MBL fold metallo-hydrolase [Clostridia bacterium]|nr:MBL fold metallo-hydrolase [Clostridia bacterium]